MDKKLYPLDVGQMLQYLPIRETGTQRCCNISIFSGLQAFVSGSLPRMRTVLYSSTLRNGMTGTSPLWISPTSP